MTWKEYSNIRWYSKYEVKEFVFKYFGDLKNIVTEIVKKGISPQNSMKLLNLLTDKMKCHKLKIELSPYVEALFDLQNLCYWLEINATNSPFHVVLKY